MKWASDSLWHHNHLGTLWTYSTSPETFWITEGPRFTHGWTTGNCYLFRFFKKMIKCWQFLMAKKIIFLNKFPSCFWCTPDSEGNWWNTNRLNVSPFYLSLVSLQIWMLHNSCTPNKCWKWERGAKHSQQWSKATNSTVFRIRRHTKALSLPPPACTNSRTLKLMSKRGATCLRSHWKLHWRTQCFVLVYALNQC